MDDTKRSERLEAETGTTATAPGHETGSAVETRSAAAAEAVAYEKAFGLRFELIRNINYHTAREAYFSRFAKVMTGLQVLIGTAAFSVIATKFGPDGMAEIVALTGAVVGIVLLIIDPAASARAHQGYRARYSALLADLELAEGPALLAPTQAEIYKISAQEPPTFSAVRAMAYNETVQALYPEDLAEQYCLHVDWWSRLTAQLFPRRGKIYKPRSC